MNSPPNAHILSFARRGRALFLTDGKASGQYYGQFETAEGRATQAVHLADAVDEGELGIQMTPEPATTQTETTLELEELNPEERLALDEVAAVPETADLPVEEAAETEPPP